MSRATIISNLKTLVQGSASFSLVSDTKRDAIDERRMPAAILRIRNEDFDDAPVNGTAANDKVMSVDVEIYARKSGSTSAAGSVIGLVDALESAINVDPKLSGTCYKVRIESVQYDDVVEASKPIALATVAIVIDYR